ncbi:hypothetical protein MMC26_000874 [Xylographa opegraphella]|nr:hypothetical protein [Xylographa opegraphella]
MPSYELRIELPATGSRVSGLPSTGSRVSGLPSLILSSNIPDLPVASSDAMKLEDTEYSSPASSPSLSLIGKGYDGSSPNTSSPMSPCYAIDVSPQDTSIDDLFGPDLKSPEFLPESTFGPNFADSDVVFASYEATCALPELRKSDSTGSSEVVKALKLKSPITFEGNPSPHQGYCDEKILCHIEDSTGKDQQHCDDVLDEHHSSGPRPLIVNSLCLRKNVPGFDVQMQSQHALIEALRRVSSMLYKRSIRNLRRDPVTGAVRSFIENMPSPENIIERGLANLRRVFSNSLPNRLMDIYAMLHVTYVVAIVANQEDVAGIQRDLYADILNWSLAIKSIDERTLFVKIAELMWASEHTKMNCPRIVSDVSSGTLNQTCFTSILPPVCELPVFQSDSSSPTGFVTLEGCSNDSTALFQALKGGTAIYLCKQYLDVFEYTGLLAKSPSIRSQQMPGHFNPASQANTSAYTEYWEAVVTRPLLELMGLEGFCIIVGDVQRMLGRGAFGTLREAELKLIFDGQVCRLVMT